MAAADEKTAKTRRPGIFRLGVFLFALAAAVSAAVFLPGFFGLTELNVTAGSMAPELPEGTLVLVRAVEPETVEEGEVLSFTAPKGEEGIVTHRVVRIAHHKTAKPVFFCGEIPVRSDFMLVKHGLEQLLLKKEIQRETDIAVTIVHPFETDGIVAGIEIRNKILPCMAYLDTPVRNTPVFLPHNGEKHIVGIIANLDVIMLPQYPQEKILLSFLLKICPIVQELDFNSPLHRFFHGNRDCNMPRTTGSLTTQHVTNRKYSPATVPLTTQRSRAVGMGKIRMNHSRTNNGR